jgi:hypothetical protein
MLEKRNKNGKKQSSVDFGLRLHREARDCGELGRKHSEEGEDEEDMLHSDEVRAFEVDLRNGLARKGAELCWVPRGGSEELREEPQRHRADTVREKRRDDGGGRKSVEGAAEELEQEVGGSARRTRSALSEESSSSVG